jgi:hypothetical protein
MGVKLGLTLREELSLGGEVKSRALRGTFVPKGEEVTGERR